MTDHCEFYNWGKLLKIVVNVFGQRFDDKYNTHSIHKLYHGVSEQLLFPVHGINRRDNGLCLHSPLSTSLAFEVAVGFTQQNQGLIVSFEGLGTDHNVEVKHFSVDWLSNYANEREYLFLQMSATWVGTNMSSIAIENIIDPHTGIEYIVIIQALKHLDGLMNCYNPSNINNKKYIQTKFTSAHAGQLKLIKKIVHHQLSKEMKEFEAYESLTEYGKNICNTYFQNQNSDYLQQQPKQHVNSTP
eukprot:316526_1